MKYLIVSFLVLLTSACASQPQKSELDSVFTRMSDSQYEKLVLKYTDSDKKYTGFYNTYQVQASIINNDISEGLLQREGYFMQWSQEQARDKRSESISEQTQKTKVFISLFTPKYSHNDLHKGKSMWRVYLEQNGQRIEGKATKAQYNLDQMHHLFPYHNRFSNAYWVTFNVPTTDIEKSESKLILTSSLGTSVLKFSEIKR